MGVELDNRRVSDCPWRRIEYTSKRHHRKSRLVCCSNTEHGGLCAYDGKVALWRCKFSHDAKGQDGTHEN